MIQRNEYLNQLIRLKDKDLIKVITGIRRCGKSTLFEIYQDYLVNKGVAKDQIISINFEDADYYEINDFKKLNEYIKNKLIKNKMNYIFLDEIHHVKEYQRAVDSFYIKKNCDIYMTGSNAYFLSSELATLLSGRYVEIKMMPLSFKEYMSTFNEKIDIRRRYNNYLINSSFPYALELSKKKDIKIYLEGIYTTVILKDVVARKGIKDVGLLESVIKFMFDNIGNLCSVKKIADTIKSTGRTISVQTVESYLTALCESFILYKVNRYDIKGKQHLKTLEKYYLADIGLRYYLLGTKPADTGHILENIVYLELVRRGYEVHIGKIGNAEVDFIAINEEGASYYQVAYTVTNKETLDRELSSLNKINNHNPKYLLTLDEDIAISHDGIKQINALDWLLE